MVVGFYDKVGWDLEKRNIEVLGFLVERGWLFRHVSMRARGVQIRNRSVQETTLSIDYLEAVVVREEIGWHRKFT